MSDSSAADVFVYQAQLLDGQTITGTIEAADAEQARIQLAAMNLHLLNVEPEPKPRRPKALGGDDLIAFNQQLAHLTQAGMPIEHGLRLVAQDMRSGRLAATINRLADELDNGRSLGEAFELHRHQFPVLYGRLIDAGVKTGTLSAVLLNLGQHLELLRRLRQTIANAVAYPIIVLIGLVMVVCMLGFQVLPPFESIFEDFDTELPGLTKFVLTVGPVVPWIALGALVLVILIVIFRNLIRGTELDRHITDIFVLPIPLLGTILSRNLLARWCDAVHQGTAAGLDLPAAIALAGDAIASPSLRADSEKLVETLSQGRLLQETEHLAVIPPMVTVAMDLACQRNDLPVMLGTLRDLYHQSAEARIGTLHTMLMPLMVLILAGLVGSVIVALFLPLTKLIQGLT